MLSFLHAARRFLVESYTVQGGILYGKTPLTYALSSTAFSGSALALGGPVTRAAYAQATAASVQSGFSTPSTKQVDKVLGTHVQPCACYWNPFDALGRRLAERTFEHSGAGRSVVRTTFRLMQNSTDPQAGFAPADTIAQEKLSTTQNDPLIQYVVLRQDLATELKWPLGAVVAQACHAAVDALGLAMEADKETARRYLAAGSSMRTVVLQVANEAELLKLQDKLKKNHIGHKLWQEEPENIPTALASVPIQKSAARVFRGFKLLS
ncbi:uncharacterized protein LOC113146456 [Cyclospora cayetanensis]|uniref:peptidyl-tRNA hydrolase n=1 Tax=Cyclospora cayetanensis TaxID=88456 RepID=A0A6P6RRA8_9EIME|nr:uncharacterized protein LOC113146456 [Cyclospora cayetanensis]